MAALSMRFLGPILVAFLLAISEILVALLAKLLRYLAKKTGHWSLTHQLELRKMGAPQTEPTPESPIYLSEILDLVVLVPNDHRVPRIDDR
jgi:hypothetical protein